MDDKERIDRLERAFISLTCALIHEIGDHNVNAILDILSKPEQQRHGAEGE